MSWYFVKSVLHIPVSSIMPTRIGITALFVAIVLSGPDQGGVK